MTVDGERATKSFDFGTEYLERVYAGVLGKIIGNEGGALALRFHPFPQYCSARALTTLAEVEHPLEPGHAYSMTLRADGNELIGKVDKLTLRVNDTNSPLLEGAFAFVCEEGRLDVGSPNGDAVVGIGPIKHN